MQKIKIKKKYNNKYKKNIQILDLGMHPFADTFIKKNQLEFSEPIFPLKCQLNEKTGIISSMVKTDVFSRYNLYDYSYTSSNSMFLKNYWKKLSKDLTKNYSINENTKILEIGSNDGFLISKFKSTTKNLLAVDASKFMTKISKKKGIKSVNLIFSKKKSNMIKKRHGLFDIILANNVVHHSNDPDDFIKGVRKILKKNGIFIFEVPYWLSMVKSKNFDQVYHEHTTYFTVKSLNYLCNKNNIQISKIEFTENHGSSLRVFAKVKKKPKINKQSKSLIAYEIKNKIFNPKTYRDLQKKIFKKKINLLKKIYKYKLKNYKIIGIGASAKANTFLNYMGLNNSIIDYITDRSKFKINKFTPLSRIPIYDDNKIKFAGNKVLAITLAWNLGVTLKKKILKINNKVKFLSI